MTPSTSSLLSKTVVLVIMGMCSAFSILRSIPKNHRNWHPSPLSSSKRQRLNKEEEEEECLLIPETNPDFNPNATSLSGVSYSRVISGIDALYPPYELSNRNAQSRTDGYWKYVERGEKPPQEFTYGEFDIEFFGALLDISWKHYLEGQHNEQQLSPTSNPWINKTFCDIGSGAGRLVVTAAALHPEWELCRGIEILPNLHNISASIADGCRVYSEESNNVHHILRIRRNEQGENSPTNTNECHDDDHLPLAPIKFTCGSFTDPYEYLGDIDCAFVFSSCMKPDLVRQLSLAIGRQCKPGTIIITTEFPLFLRGAIDPFEEDESIPHGQYEIQLLEKIDGWCWLLGGKSTAYIHRVKSSLWEEYAGPREMQQLTLEEDAFRLVQSIENGELTDTKAFLRRVRNDMIFHGVPHEFLPPEIADDHPESNSATDEEE